MLTKSVFLHKKSALELIKKYFPELSAQQLAHFEALEDLYMHWNAQINVISRKDMNNFYTHHVLHALSIAKVIQFKEGAKILDVGTGGGFPGIPLAILFPQCAFDLVDAIGKKIMVVKSVANALGLTNVNAYHARAEQMPDKQYDFILARAVTNIDAFVLWVQNKCKEKSIHELKNGILYLKGGDLSAEFASHAKKARFFEINDFFEESFFETKKVVYLPL